MSLINKIKQKGGLTCNVNLTEFTASKGYAVSMLGYETRVKLDDTLAIETLVERYQAIIANILRNTALDVKLGFWIDSGELYIDVSQIVPDLETALYLGRAREQKAIYSFETKQVITLV